MYSSPTYEHLVDKLNTKYMDSLLSRNPGLLETAFRLHQSGEIPPNTYLLDLDAHRKNARLMVDAAAKHDVTLYFMSKQVNRNPLICKAVLAEGFTGMVAVEMQCVRSLHRYGIKISHVGHLVQIPVNDIDYVLSAEPDVWTVYSFENARAISDKIRKTGRTQDLLVQPIGKGDLFFDSMSGGIPESEIVQTVKKINSLPGVRVVGTTSFPCMLYDIAAHEVRPIPNFMTAVRTAEQLEKELGIEITQINTPGNNHTTTMKTVAENGGTHAEPGSGMLGGNTAHTFHEEPELPAFVYVTEVSHLLGDKVYAHGGGMAFPGGGWGLLPDGTLWEGGNNIGMDALVGRDLASGRSTRLRSVLSSADPFNYNLPLALAGKTAQVGDTVAYGFITPQVFVSRGWNAVVEGISENNPRLLGVYDQGGHLVDSKGRPLGEKAAEEILEKV
ncbi:MAG: alanine racemase [Thaumarchaeota archaeon]|nr:alanine racemase [Nitrososphaerota archaeon]